ncbi:hypothetical protein AAVH_24229 [Aphelenchoides avenae]|nr:hypothetical protein AAVH_24229 [Aphelenchus avenae]
MMINDTPLDPHWSCSDCPTYTVDVMSVLPTALRTPLRRAQATNPYDMACMMAVIASESMTTEQKQSYLDDPSRLPVSTREVAAFIPSAYHHFLTHDTCRSRQRAILAAAAGALVYRQHGPLDAIRFNEEFIGREMELVVTTVLQRQRSIRTPLTLIADSTQLRIGKRWGDLTYIEATSASTALTRVSQTYFTRGARFVIIWLPLPNGHSAWLPPLQAMVNFILAHRHVGVLLLPPITDQPKDAAFTRVIGQLREIDKHPRLFAPIDAFTDELLVPYASRSLVFHGPWVKYELLAAAKRFVLEYQDLGHYRSFMSTDNTSDEGPPTKRPLTPFSRKRSLGGPSASGGGGK